MRFNPAIEGRVGGVWQLACSPYGIESIQDPTTWGILKGTRPEFPPIPVRGLPVDISAGLSAMIGVMGTTGFSYFTLEEIKAYAALVVGEDAVERSISGDLVREKAPLLGLIVRRMISLATSFGVSDVRVRLVYGYD